VAEELRAEITCILMIINRVATTTSSAACWRIFQKALALTDAVIAISFQPHPR
jgi:hypothetical protein